MSDKTITNSIKLTLNSQKTLSLDWRRWSIKAVALDWNNRLIIMWLCN